ncbi:zinc-binding dehydrogenase [bacterium]|nr:zinc-binding dehydrogenase [bacterium]
MSSPPLPDQMTAIVLDSYSGVAALRVEQRPVPKPKKNEVLVRVAASPINPSDLAFLEGLYGIEKKTPTIPGFEGSGTVVAAGNAFMGRYLIGKRVACIGRERGDGVWAEYMVTSTKYALPLADSVDLVQGAMSVINPLTAIALISMAKQAGQTAIINTAAASALGQMIDRLGRSEGLRVVNIVRREAQVEILKRVGAQLVLDSSETKFEQNLKEICQQQQIRLAFDAVAGSMTLHLIEALPPKSKVTIYGGLSFEAAQANPGQLIFQEKTVDGFWLTAWLAQKSLIQKMLIWRKAQKMLKNELKTEIRAKYPLEDAKKAVIDYQEHMTGGKVLFVPDL